MLSPCSWYTPRLLSDLLAVPSHHASAWTFTADCSLLQTLFKSDGLSLDMLCTCAPQSLCFCTSASGNVHCPPSSNFLQCLKFTFTVAPSLQATVMPSCLCSKNSPWPCSYLSFLKLNCCHFVTVRSLLFLFPLLSWNCSRQGGQWSPTAFPGGCAVWWWTAGLLQPTAGVGFQLHLLLGTVWHWASYLSPCLNFFICKTGIILVLTFQGCQ